MSGLRFGFIGAGGNARGHGKRLLAIQGVQVVALADPSGDSLGAFGEAVFNGGPRAANYDDYREMLEKEQLDAVLVSSPHTLHTDQILDSLRAGLHVLAEKPLACSEADTHKIIAEVEKSGKQLMVSFQRRLKAVFRHMKSIIRDPGFGRAMTVASFVSQNWLSSQTGTWRQKLALSGGGQLNDTGAHIIDMVMWMLDDEVAEVSAFIENRGREVDIDSAVSYRTKGGAVGTLTVMGSSPKCPMWEDMTINGDGGSAFFYRRGKLWVVRENSGEFVEEEIPGEDLDPDRHFVDVVTGKAANQSPPSDFLRNIKFTEAVWASAANGGKPVALL
jgi:predicted dehydrogenase